MKQHLRQIAEEQQAPRLRPVPTPRAGAYVPRKSSGPAAPTGAAESRTSVTLCAPGGPPVATVREWTPSDPDLSTALRQQEAAAKRSRYQRVKMAVSPQQDSAEWDYTFTDAKMGALRGLEQAVTIDGRAYLIQWRTPAREWAAHLPGLGVVMNSFRTTG